MNKNIISKYSHPTSLVDAMMQLPSGLQGMEFLHALTAGRASEFSSPRAIVRVDCAHMVFAEFDQKLPIVHESDDESQMLGDIELTTVTFMGVDALELFLVEYLLHPLEARILVFERAPSHWVRNMERRLDHVLLNAAVRVDEMTRPDKVV